MLCDDVQLDVSALTGMCGISTFLSGFGAVLYPTVSLWCHSLDPYGCGKAENERKECDSIVIFGSEQVDPPTRNALAMHSQSDGYSGLILVVRTDHFDSQLLLLPLLSRAEIPVELDSLPAIPLEAETADAEPGFMNLAPFHPHSSTLLFLRLQPF